jgi:hypothetical protein
MDLGLQVLTLAEEEVSLRSHGVGPGPPAWQRQVIPAQCEEVVMARLENTLGVENGLVEHCTEACPSE